MPVCLPNSKHETPAGDRLRGEPHVLVSADTRKKALFR